MSSATPPTKDRYITIEEKKVYKFIIPKNIVKDLAAVYKQTKQLADEPFQNEKKGYYLTLHMRCGATITLNPVDVCDTCNMVEEESFDDI